MNFKGTTNQKIEFLTNRFSNSKSGQKGLADFKSILSLLASYGATEEHVDFDISLARGLSYYTGCIFEVKINNVAIGSVSGGGRYDNLTGSFGLEGVSGIGISFGVDRLYDAMEELKLFPMDAQISSKVLICHFDEESKRYGLKNIAEASSEWNCFRSLSRCGENPKAIGIREQENDTFHNCDRIRGD